jgi:hypothetical protein
MDDRAETTFAWLTPGIHPVLDDLQQGLTD